MRFFNRQETETNQSGNNKFKNDARAKLIPACFALIGALLLLLLLIVIPKQTYSWTEGENLSTFPKATVDSLMSGSFAESVEKYLNNHFFLRDFAVSMKNNLAHSAGVREINDTFILDNQLVKNIKKGNLTAAEKNITAVGAFIKEHTAEKPSFFGLIPTASEVYKDKLPACPDVLNQAGFITSMYRELQTANTLPETTTIDIYSSMTSQKSEKLFYNTDDRWTSMGAYVGYSAVAKGLGITPKLLEEFNIEHANHNYYGNLSHRTSIYPTKPDVIDLYHYVEGDPVKRVDIDHEDGVKSYSSLYFSEALDGSHQESVFLGKAEALIELGTSTKNGEHLLLFRDNYSNAMMQFLSLHYETITLVDLNLLNEQQAQSLHSQRYTSILFLYNVENFISDNNIFSKLSLLQG